MLHLTPKAYGSLGHDESSHQKKTTVTKFKGAHLLKWLAAVFVLEGVGAATVPWSAEPVASGSNSSVSLMSPKENASTARVSSRRLIAGGDPVTPNEHNWVLRWEAPDWYGRVYTCGASLIDEQWAMTAAHCTKGKDTSKMVVHVHRHAFDGGAGEHECAETLSIDKKFEHPDYKSHVSGNDIALLRLSQPVGCADSITKPYLDDGSYSGADTTATMAGWGDSSFGGSSTDVLHSIDLKLLTNAKCETYGYADVDLPDSTICAIGDLKGGEGACSGDSGGPLFVQQGRMNIIVGVVSWGLDYCAAKEKIAAVYTRVSSYKTWIEESMGLNSPLTTGAYGSKGCGAGKCDVCQGDCDSDADCKSGLRCFQRNGLTPVPGCSGDGAAFFDYCVKMG